MTMFASQWLANPSTGYTIDQSIRFNDNDTAFLKDAAYSSSPTSSTDCTLSFWVKRCNLGSTQCLFFGGDGSGSTWEIIRFESDNQFRVGQASSAYDLTTSQAFVDPSAWSHFVVAFDTDNGTAADRIKIYHNGSRITDFSLQTNPSSGYVTNFNSGGGSEERLIGFQGPSSGGSNAADCYLAEINFIDGQALDPTSFGETDSDSGQFIPKKYAGSYGTNGYYLKGQDSSALGDDSSGNGNDFTSSGLAAADQVTDSPTNNQSTLNPLWAGATLSDGNLVATASGNSYQWATSTIAIDDGGKHVCEFQKSSGTFGYVGIFQLGNHTATTGNNYMYGLNLGNGEIVKNSSLVTDIGAGAANSLMRIEYDSSADTIKIFDDGTEVFPASTGVSNTVGLTGHDSLHFGCAPYASGTVITATFSPLSGTPTTDFKELTTTNLSDPTIADGSEYYHPQTYTGNGSSGLAITNDASAGDFKPDILWLAPRSNGDNKVFFDSVRGTTQRVKSNSNDPEDTDGTAQLTFETDGFDLDTTDVNFNGSGRTYVAWQWHTTGGTTSSNTDGSITSTVSANATAGVSIVTYTGSGANATVGHSLNTAPKMLLIKNRTDTDSWVVYHDALGATKGLAIDNTDAPTTASTFFNNTAPTSSVFSVGSGGRTNGSSKSMLCYCFAEVVGFSKFGSYKGNGSTDGPFVYTGFKPRWVLFRRYSGAEGWSILDTARGSGNFGSAAGSGGTDPTAGNDMNNKINANDGAGEEDNPTGSRRASFLSNGFKLRTTNTAMNSSDDFLYMAFAECPFKVATAR